jgi:hypothetical protein
MNAAKSISDMINDRNKGQAGSAKYRSVENDAAISANAAGVKAVGIDWSQGRVSHVQVNALVTGYASQTLTLTGYWQLDSSAVGSPIRQVIQQGYFTLNADFLLNAISSGKHVLDFYLKTDTGTFAVDPFSCKMYIGSSGITNAGEVLPKIKITQAYTGIPINFAPSIVLVDMTDKVIVTVATDTPIALPISEVCTGIPINFTSPSIGLVGMSDNVNITLV